MNIEQHISKYLIKANEFVKQTLDYHTQNTNNIDEFSEEFIKDFLSDDKFTDLNDDLLYRHLTASKAIAQLAWNIFRADMCYINKCEINEKHLYQIFQNLENKEFYEKHFQNILGKKYDKSSIIDVISRYLIIFCILHHKEVPPPNIKVCMYCDNEELGNICTICGGDEFNYKNNNLWSAQTVTSNENKPSGELENINTNLKNENLSCYKDNLLDNEHIGNNKSNFDSKSCLKSVNEAVIFDECFVEKKVECDETETNKINSQSLENPLPISHQESQLLPDRCKDNCSFSNNNYEELAKIENVENLNKDKKEHLNDSVLFWTCSKCSYKNNEQTSQFCSVCITNKMGSMDNNEDFDKANQIDDCLVSELTDVNKDCNLSSSNIDTMNTDQWICDQCSFINNKDDGICAVCLANNQDVKYDFPEEMWICRKCNERNPFDCYKCFNCDNFSDFFNQWVCEKCSYFNDKKARYCHVCEEKNLNLVKCSECSRSNVNKMYDDKCESCKNKPSNQTSKDIDIIDSLGEKLSQLSVKDPEDIHTILKSDKKLSSNNNKEDCIDTNFQKSKIYSNPSDSYKNNLWFCQNHICCGVNFKAAEYCDKCKLKRNSYLSRGALCTFYEDNREISKWYCECCKIFCHPSSLPCSQCGNHRLKITPV